MVGSSRILMFQTSTLRTLTSGLILAVAYSQRLSKKRALYFSTEAPPEHSSKTMPNGEKGV